MENTRKNKKHVNLRWLIPGFFLLCNPEIAGLDVLPDFIGYLMIMVGIYFVSDMNSKLRDAMRFFQKLFIISVVQFVLFIIVLSIPSAGEQSTAYLCITFAVMLFSVIFGIPAWSKAFDGFSYLGMKFETTATDGRRFSVAKTATVIFVVCKPFLPFIAELSSLSIQDFQSGNTFVNWYEHVDLYRALVTVLILAAGILWLVLMIRAFRPLLQDSRFIESLSNAYNADVRPNFGLFLLRRIRVSYFLLGLSVLFHVEVIIDGNNVLPSVVTPCLMILSVLVLSPFSPKIRNTLWVLAGLFISSFFYLFYENAFYTLNLSQRSDVSGSHQAFTAIACVYQCLFILSVFFINRFIADCMQTNLFDGTAPGRYDNTIISDEKGKLLLLSISSILCGGVSAYTAIAAIIHPAFQIVSLLISALFTLFFCSSLRRNYELYRNRYRDI